MFDHKLIRPIKGLQRLLGLTLLKDFNTLLEVCLIKWILTIHFECHPIRGFSYDC